MRKIIGSGGKGGGSSRVAQEAPDSLLSTQKVSFIDLWCEGEIEGLVNGAQSIYFDKTPLENEDGTANFTNVSYDYRYGTVYQEYMEGFGTVQNTESVDVEVTYDTPVVRTLTNLNADRVNVELYVPQLYQQNPTNGDTYGTSVEMQISIQPTGGSFVVQKTGFNITTLPIKDSDRVTTAVSPLVSTGYDLSFSVEFITRAYEYSDGGTPVPNHSGYMYWSGLVQTREVGTLDWVTVKTVAVNELTAQVTSQVLIPGASEYDPSYLEIKKIAKFNVSANNLTEMVREFRVIPTDTKLSTCWITKVHTYKGQEVTGFFGKTTSRYSKTYSFKLEGTGPWDIKVERLTADSTTQTIVNKTYFGSITPVIEAKLRYPNSAYIGITLDAQQFGSIPTRAYDLKLLKIKVPSNYNPISKEYTGVWDGTFVTAWSDNPAWCFYDLLTNERYGLGEHISESQIDKWELYTIGQYCDELVYDGFGSREPRFTLNCLIQTREQAYKVVQDLASVFRGMTYWASGVLKFSQDAPGDPVDLYSVSNVKEGLFTYTGAATSARHTVALVTWNDPEDFYKQKVEYVEDYDSILKYGVIETQVYAFGCTSRGQAHRTGQWILYTERYESESVMFKTGIEGCNARPGQLILINDPNRAGLRMGGRISSATTTTITLDSVPTLPTGTFSIYVKMPDGSVESSAIESVVDKTVNLVSALSVAPKQQSQFMISGTALEPQTYRVITMSEEDEGEIEITALRHESGKYDYIENNVKLPMRTYSVLNAIPDAPADVTITESLYLSKVEVKVRVTASWDIVLPSNGYRVVYSFENGNYIYLPDTQLNSVELPDAREGLYRFRVWSLNALGKTSSTYAEKSLVVVGKTAPPSDVEGLTYYVDKSVGITLQWDNVTDIDIRYYEVRSGTDWDTGTLLAQVSANSFTLKDMFAGSNTFWVKAVDTSGIYSLGDSTVTVDVSPLAAPSISVELAGPNSILRWGHVDGSLAVGFYEIRRGATFEAAEVIATVKGTTFSEKVTFGGQTNYYVVGVDILGVYGSEGAVDMNVIDPKSVDISAEVIDNNVLLRWGDSTTTLPIDYYEIRKGEDWDTGQQVGKLFAQFTAIPEPTSGTFTYRVKAVDTAGNQSESFYVAATVRQPKDYALLLDYNSDFSGTRHNIGGTLTSGVVAPSYSDHTWTDHFILTSMFIGRLLNGGKLLDGSVLLNSATRAPVTPQEQIDAGYPQYIQPTPSSAYYEEEIDYGAVLPGTEITVTLTSENVVGTVAVTTTISYKQNVGDAWTTVVANSTYATNFRYIKVRLDFAGSDDKAFRSIKNLNIKLDYRKKSDRGTVAVLSTDSGGTVVNFNETFMDIESITLSPLTTTAAIACYDFVDTANPTSFKILLYNTSGVRISGTVSWTANGV